MNSNNMYDKLLVGCLAWYYLQLKKKSNKKVFRKLWVHPLWQDRELQGSYHNLVKDLRKYPNKFKNYCRLTLDEYDKLLQMVKPLLVKKSNRPSLPPGLRLMLTLRYLASGDSMISMAYSYRVGPATVSGIIKETCRAIWSILAPTYLKAQTKSDIIQVKEEFAKKWNFPNCIGCIDGKHVQIRAPNKSGTLFYNYKKNFSIVLLGVCDASLKFLYVDIGAYGHESDGGILKNSAFGKKLELDQLNVPAPECLPKAKDGKKIPHCLVGDAAFPLKKYLMKPYGGKNLTEAHKIFNYRLARARNCIERAFGVLVSRWRILFSILCASPSTVDDIIKATVVLHNYIIVNRKDPIDTNCNEKIEKILKKSTGLQDKSSISSLRFGNRNSAIEVYEQRNYLASYFHLKDILPWQQDSINIGRHKKI